MVLQLGDINFQEFGYGIKSMFPFFHSLLIIVFGCKFIFFYDISLTFQVK